MKQSVEQIAKACHASHLTYSEYIGCNTQPSWDEVSQTHKNVVYDSIIRILNGEFETVEQAHSNFVETKYKNGWSYGDVYSLEEKTNPRLTHFELLSKENQTKDKLFFNIVKSFM